MDASANVGPGKSPRVTHHSPSGTRGELCAELRLQRCAPDRHLQLVLLARNVGETPSLTFSKPVQAERSRSPASSPSSALRANGVGALRANGVGALRANGVGPRSPRMSVTMSERYKLKSLFAHGGMAEVYLGVAL